MLKTSISAAALALALSTGAAMAADLPSHKAPPPVYVAPPLTWTGFYVGLNAGYTWSEDNSFTSAGGPIFSDTTGLNNAGAAAIAGALGVVGTHGHSLNSDGFIGGGQIGYNWQFWNSFVVGLEADIQGIATSKKNSVVGQFTSLAPFGFPAESYSSASSASKSVDYIGTVRGRLGYLVTPTLLVYGTGGLAYGQVNVDHSIIAAESLGAAVYPAIAGSTSYSDTRVGWTAGGGLEWMFLPNWSAKAEYLYYDLGTVVSSPLVLSQVTAFGGGFIPWGAAASQSSTRFNGHIVRAGVNYHFSWGAPAPVLAKY